MIDLVLELAGRAFAALWKFLRALPWQVWAVLALLAAVYAYGEWKDGQGERREHAKFAAHLGEDIAATALANQRKALQEQHDRAAFAAAAARFEREKADAVAKEHAVADALRRGALRLRKPWACPAAQLPDAAGRAEGTDAAADLRAASAGRIVRVGAECDAQVNGLQELLRIERETPAER